MPPQSPLRYRQQRFTIISVEDRTLSLNTVHVRKAMGSGHVEECVGGDTQPRRITSPDRPSLPGPVFRVYEKLGVAWGRGYIYTRISIRVVKVVNIACSHYALIMAILRHFASNVSF